MKTLKRFAWLGIWFFLVQSAVGGWGTGTPLEIGTFSCESACNLTRTQMMKNSSFRSPSNGEIQSGLFFTVCYQRL